MIAQVAAGIMSIMLAKAEGRRCGFIEISENATEG
jgi:hypothetical protein